MADRMPRLVNEVATVAILADEFLMKQSALLSAQFRSKSRVSAEFLIAVSEAAPVGIDAVAVFDVIPTELDLYFPALARRFAGRSRPEAGGR